MSGHFHESEKDLPKTWHEFPTLPSRSDSGTRRDPDFVSADANDSGRTRNCGVAGTMRRQSADPLVRAANSMNLAESQIDWLAFTKRFADSVFAGD